ncbi:YbbR-like domain-containing protein [Brochothrix campestris]|uniref:CdaR family protein n=1 Tax=Brochothrix campestris TaxID=2757 RepID=UPI0038D07908
MIDRILSSRWALRVLALVLTLVLYSVTTDTAKETDSSLSLLGNDTEVITDVPVEVINDSKDVVVSGVPEAVTMKVTGSRNVIKAMEQQGDFKVEVNLHNASVGTQVVKLEAKDLPEGIKAVITPKEVTVTIQEKITKEFIVEPELSSGLVAAGFKAGTPTTDVSTIKVTGPRDTILNITTVKAKVTAERALTETTTIKTNVTVLDNNYNKITNVELNKTTVEVTVPVSQSGKSVPIKLIQKGIPKDNVTIASLNANISEVTLEGDAKVLDEIDVIEVPVDVSDVTGTIIKKIELTVPAKTTLISSPVINVTISTGQKVKTVKQNKKTTVEKKDTSNNEVTSESELFSSNEKATSDSTEVENTDADVTEDTTEE